MSSTEARNRTVLSSVSSTAALVRAPCRRLSTLDASPTYDEASWKLEKLLEAQLQKVIATSCNDYACNEVKDILREKTKLVAAADAPRSPASVVKLPTAWSTTCAADHRRVMRGVGRTLCAMCRVKHSTASCNNRPPSPSRVLNPSPGFHKTRREPRRRRRTTTSSAGQIGRAHV